MSIEENRREAFEAWAAVNGISIVRTSQALAFANGQSRAVGDYIMIESLCAWAAWNAALDQIHIRKPVEPYSGQGFPQPSYSDCLKDMEKSLNESGLEFDK